MQEFKILLDTIVSIIADIFLIITLICMAGWFVKTAFFD